MSINWANLVAKGRAKAIGVPWSEEEAAARAVGVPAEYVRDGILTLEEYEKAKAKDDKNGPPLERMPLGELRTLAAETGFEFTPETPPETLIAMLNDPKQVKAAKTAKAAKEQAAKDADKEAKKAADKAAKAAAKANKE